MKTQRLLEVVQSTGPLVVDREAGLIRGVRILGSASANSRRYTPQAIRGGVSLYEGMRVNYDHPPQSDPTQWRLVADRGGWFSNVREANDGLIGDLNLLMSDPRAEKVFEAAERRSDLLGMSHNAVGKIRRENGVTIVEEIVNVRSVDIVSDPATVRSLFESIEQEEANQMPTIKFILENVDKKTRGWKHLREIVEDETLPTVTEETSVDVEPEEVDADEQIKAALNSAAKAAIDDSSLDTVATVKKVKEILTAEDKLLSGGEKSETETTEEKPEEEKATAESKQYLAKLEKNIERLTEAVTELKGRVGIEKPKSGQLSESKNGGQYTPPKDATELMERCR